MTDIVLGILLITITNLLYFSFLKGCFNRSVSLKKAFLLLAVVTVIHSVFSVLFVSYVPVKILMSLLPLVGFAKLSFDLPLSKSILAGLIFSGIFVSSEMVVFLIFQSKNGSNRLSDMTNQTGGVVAELISQLIVLFVVLILTVLLKKTNLSRMDYKGWAIFTLFPVFTLIIVIVMIREAEREMPGELLYGLLFLVSGLLILNIMHLLLLDNVIERETEIRRKQLLIEQAVHLNQMYQTLSKERERQKALSHDYKNHLQVMLLLAREGKTGEEIKYIEEQIGKVDHGIDTIDTGNAIVNAVLNAKYLEAKESGIVIPFIADNLADIRISDSDLVTIITNVLDNAIEAVKMCDDKRIEFKIIKDKDTLIIDSSNPYIGQFSDGDDMHTTKFDKANHGYGIANIRKATEENNGNCYIETDNGVFHITIAIPI